MKTDAVGPRAVSAATGVSTDTLRHYERLGLLPRTARTSAGYRRYDPAVISRVQLIQRALVVGFSLKDLASVLRRRDFGQRARLLDMLEGRGMFERRPCVRRFRPVLHR